jgi:hypothetical protein
VDLLEVVENAQDRIQVKGAEGQGRRSESKSSSLTIAGFLESHVSKNVVY